jgi:putative SOS response-associated peptidase YedK
MCGRYRIKDTDLLTAHLRRTFGIPDWVMAPRYNIAPSQSLPVISRNVAGEAVVTPMRWGFVPFWEKFPKPKVAPINAQSEKVATNGLFRSALQRHRCVVPADGFYEWLRLDESTKAPFDIHLRDGRPFFMAGVFEPATESRPATYAILTTAANTLVARIHSRMPAILEETEAHRWLTPGPIAAEEVATLTEPHPAEDMAAVPVSPLVNSPRHDLPECLAPVDFVPPPVQRELFD